MERDEGAVIGQPCACGTGTGSALCECRAESTLTLANPSDALRYEAGEIITFSAGPPRWWKRLWRWMRRGFRKAPPPPRYVVTAVKGWTVTMGEAP